MKIIKYIIYTLIISFIYFNVSALTDEQITLTSVIDNVSSNVENTYIYEIEPSINNPIGATDEPNQIIVKFDNVKPNINKVTANYVIDFKNTNYQKPGIYEYIIKEKSSSNTDYMVSNQKYKIYVTVTNENNNLIKKVHNQVVNIDTLEKTSLIFDHKANDTIKDPNVANTGLFLNYLPFIFLILIGFTYTVAIIIFNYKSGENE